MAIYILKSDGSLIKFLKGAQETFTVSGLDGNFVSPAQVVTDYDFDNIYVADSGNKRVVVLNKQGALVKQYLNNDTEAWSDIKGISVSSDEKTLYVLAGSRVFIVPL
jgi:DNA-binding beta-propeller fold protein YncE